jgi:hypothetical protein
MVNCRKYGCRCSDIGTVIHGTHRPEDLIPRFIEEASDRIANGHPHATPKRHVEFVKRVGEIQSELGDIERRIAARTDYFQTEYAMWDLEALFDLLDELAPTGTGFGAHEGDGSDFGFWSLGVWSLVE